MQVMTVREANMAMTTGTELALRQRSVSVKLPRSAPAVRPRRAKAASRTEGLLRVRKATRMSAPAQKMVERLLKRRKNSSSRARLRRFFITSIVETEARAVIAELTLDIAAERIATMRKPFKTCGTAVTMKIG